MMTKFLWGVATSAYQIEGAATEDGRLPSIWDRFAHTPGKTQEGATGDVACNHYHLYADDVKLMQDIGVNAYRFSVSWPRVLPHGRGQVNVKGLDFYSRLVDELLAADITPFLTLYHWDLPQTLQEDGGWANRDTALAFADYAAIMAEHLGDRIPLWSTHNEPWCTVFLGHQIGLFAPGIQDFELALQASHHVLLSHGLAVAALRRVLPTDAQVGITPNVTVAKPASDSEADRGAAQRFDGYFNRWFLDPLTGKGYPQDIWDYYGDKVPQVQAGDLEIIATPLDFLGINYYNTNTLTDDPSEPNLGVKEVTNPHAPRTADREIEPSGLYTVLLRFHQDYDFPAYYITENGAAYDDEPGSDGDIHDLARIAFLASHFAQAQRAIAAGVPLQGYFVWSLMDNFEWAMGYKLRYGITYVDYTTQTRTLKDSAKFYREFIRNFRTEKEG